jgi:hypothetical protein
MKSVSDHEIEPSLISQFSLRMSLTARQQVLRSYRRVLKAALVTFQNDAPRVADSFAAARRLYLQFSNLTDDAEIRRMAAVCFLDLCFFSLASLIRCCVCVYCYFVLPQV